MTSYAVMTIAVLHQARKRLAHTRARKDKLVISSTPWIHCMRNSAANMDKIFVGVRSAI
jgi:hypothetical protein